MSVSSPAAIAGPLGVVSAARAAPVVLVIVAAVLAVVPAPAALLLVRLSGAPLWGGVVLPGAPIHDVVQRGLVLEPGGQAGAQLLQLPHVAHLQAHRAVSTLHSTM